MKQTKVFNPENLRMGLSQKQSEKVSLPPDPSKDYGPY